MKGDRRTFLKSAGVAGTIALAGCISSTDDSGSTSTPTEESTESSGDETDTQTEEQSTSTGEVAANVGMVYATGGLGDKSFNDMAQRGAIQAKEELGIAFDEAQPETNSDFKPAQRQFAQETDPNYDLISCIGFAQTDALKENASRYSDQHFMLVDSVVEADNVANYVFKEHEGSFQVGHLAGLLTSQSFSTAQAETSGDSTTLGFVGGVKAPLIEKFQAGFEAGAKYANSDIDVQSSYIGSFNDPTAGKEAAASMYDSGADIVYHASGATGLGVFQAAKEKGKFAIGVDADQSRSDPDFKEYILASMVKRVNTAVFEAIESEVNGEFQGGSVITLGLERNGVECVYGQTLGSEIPQSIKDKISQSREDIINGDISVPQTP
ncbi:BMP family protein [Haloarchaeobius sp. HME9146]|uniref:BMP family lipoprotein n=1 Tax=Haloarchaeobius sp. HME9146 TaxID=2978732 RepID=UPI0021C1D7AB|nr:BMP family protein [Haloarchaeobius sp. HME9146]MCT9097234.1 BMP family protein [Haloarchaeobius sp. HME9146]